ncbi:MAG: hypothetical protein KGJ80_08945, partial [Chloroflexota bacterium]|nr:hypothetical protein [Chloroflexota bacterium]
SSDAHWLEAIGSVVTEFEIEGTRDIASLRNALREKRYVVCNA